MIFTEYAKRPTGFAAGLFYFEDGVKIFALSGNDKHYFAMICVCYAHRVKNLRKFCAQEENL